MNNPPRLLTTFAILTAPTLTLGRSVGALTDQNTQSVAAQCNSLDPDSFEWGHCAGFIRCMLRILPADVIAGYQSGGNIAALVPTILALVGAPPLELVQLAFVSPHRALATCLFGIGLPQGLFRQLRPKMQELSDLNHEHPRERCWTIPAMVLGKSYCKRIASSVAADATILGLGSMMLWRNWVVGNQVIITWRCEYSWLLFCWPFACVMWFFLAVGLLLFFKQSITIRYSEDYDGYSRGFADLLALPYHILSAKNATTQLRRHDAERDVHGSRDKKPPTGATAIAETRPYFADRGLIQGHTQSRGKVGKDSINEIRHVTPAISSIALGPCFTVNITMPSDHGLFSWRWYEAIIETLAVGIYLYATFVLTSVLFLSGQEGIIYAVVMVLSLAAVRVIESIVFHQTPQPQGR